MSQKKHPQENQRKMRRVKDEHGRVFETIIDLRCNDAVSRLRPMFDAPWHSERARIKYDEETGEMRVDLELGEVIVQRREAAKMFHERLVAIGQKMHGTLFDPTDPSDEVMNVAGKRPESVRWAQAAQAGDPWVLGLKKGPTPQWAKDLMVAEYKAPKDDLSWLEGKAEPEPEPVEEKTPAPAKKAKVA